MDLWRRQHGDRREHTWFSHGQRDAPARGFRIDHAFAGAPLASRLRRCGYDHAVREGGLSDHSALVLDLAEDGGAPYFPSDATRMVP